MIFTQKLLGNSTNNNEEIASCHSSDQLGSFSCTFCFSLFSFLLFVMVTDMNRFQFTCVSFITHLPCYLS